MSLPPQLVPGGPPESLRSVVVVGTGLLGGSVGLALRRRGVDVRLRDLDPAVARLAADLGAGRLDGEPDEGGGPADLAVLAVPPGRVAGVLVEAQRAGVASTYTDVASVKGQVRRDAERLGADLGSYVGGHPLAGRELSGPAAARSDLFEGRAWVLTPRPSAAPEHLARAQALVQLCAAVPVVLGESEHDRAVALVSHVPHVLAALAAARLVDADPTSLQLAGQGVRDVTRVAAGDPELWRGILAANAGAVATVLRAVRADLDAVLTSLDCPLDLSDEVSPDQDPLVDVLRRGTVGRARLPDKPHVVGAPLSELPVVVRDRPGELARLLTDVAAEGTNLEDLTIEHSPAQPVGWVRVRVRPERADGLAGHLRHRGWDVHLPTRR